ncbi:hypothetical protein H4582DRAFT_1879834 [Lactarius indigo]|nr:hypothetical protein H4582DRAFT_1879834 [Lactarius indigo]
MTYWPRRARLQPNSSPHSRRALRAYWQTRHRQTPSAESARTAFYVCHYTPTLSALVRSRDRDFNSRPSDTHSLFLVAQHDPFLPTVGG